MALALSCALTLIPPEAMIDPKRHEINTSPRGREPEPSPGRASKTAKTQKHEHHKGCGCGTPNLAQ